LVVIIDHRAVWVVSILELISISDNSDHDDQNKRNDQGNKNHDSSLNSSLLSLLFGVHSVFPQNVRWFSGFLDFNLVSKEVRVVLETCNFRASFVELNGSLVSFFSFKSQKDRARGSDLLHFFVGILHFLKLMVKLSHLVIILVLDGLSSILQNLDDFSVVVCQSDISNLWNSIVVVEVRKF